MEVLLENLFPKAKVSCKKKIIFSTPMFLCQSYIDEIHPNPHYIISKPTTTNLMESQSQNILAHIEILDDSGDEDTQEIWKKSDLFEVQMKKIEKPDGSKMVVCNYYSKEFKWSKSGGYNTYQWHVNNLHPTEIAKSKAKGQTQISRYISPNTQLLSYSITNNREELARMVFIEHLPFNFGEKVGFLNYCQRALNPSTCLVPRIILIRTLFDLYKKKKKRFGKFF